MCGVDKKRFKALPKRLLQLNYTIEVSYAQFIQHSSNAVIFAVN